MAKKSAKKKSVVKKHAPEKTIHEYKTEQILIDNFVSLQKVMTNLAFKFDSLSTQLSKLLELFEISAKALAEKDFQMSKNKEDKKIIEKLDSLSEQNKIIARGLTMMHDKIPPSGEISPPERAIPPARPMRPMGTDQYYKSISSQDRKPEMEN